jgi:hypothetical protein
MAHCVDMNGLHSSQHNLLNDEYERKMKSNAKFTDGWRDPKRRVTRGCYASHTVYEYFAQLTNTWLGTNHGLDPHFSLCEGVNSLCKAVAPNEVAACSAIDGCDSEHYPRANTQQWIEQNESFKTSALLYSLYGRARIVSYPISVNAGVGYFHWPTQHKTATFKRGYFEIDKRLRRMFVYRRASDVMTRKKASHIVPLAGAGNMVWDNLIGKVPRNTQALWDARPDPKLECLMIRTVRKQQFFVCQKELERLLDAVNEASFMKR